MVSNIKDFLKTQSIIQLTLFKVITSILAFLIIFIILFGQNFWEKQALHFNYNLLLSASNLQSKIQSQILTIEELKQDKDLTKNQKVSLIGDIVEPIINLNNIIAYYDLELELIVKNINETNISFDEIHSSIGSSNIEMNKMSIDNNIVNVNLPIYDKERLVGYVLAYAKTTDYVSESFNKFSQIIILALSLSVIIIFLIRKHIKQIECYLDQFCKIIINNDNDNDEQQILIKLPELKPVLNKISCYTNDLKSINYKLELSKDKIIRIMEGISDGFFALNRCWEFTFANIETQRIISSDKIELIGKGIWEVFPQVIGSLTYEKMQAAMSQDESVHWEAEGFTMTDQFYEYHAYPFNEGLSVFFRNNTESKQQQHELGRLERLNLIGQLAAGISHEIRNPLTTVRGFLQLFGGKSNYAQDKEYIDLMIAEIDRANLIISDFLSLAKSNTDNILPRNINTVINQVFPLLQADAFNSNKEVAMGLEILPDILINENEIKQLILNLVRNGLDVTPEQGCVIIYTYLKEDKVVIAIKDQGNGIPKEIQGKIGTPFFTTKETGTGLGLAISMGIAQRHNAVFEFETGDEGTTFYVLFPTCNS